MFRKLALLIGTAGALACSDTDNVVDPVELDDTADLHRSSSRATHQYEVTITNLTTGQPLSPGVVFTHTRRNSFLRGKASEGLRLIAENGDPSMAAMELSDARGVADVVATDAPIHRVGGPGPATLATTVSARANARYLSLAVMLICTNDGIAALRRVRLPRGSKPRTYYARAYDAGTELNEETSATVVDPCFAVGPTMGSADGNARTATNRSVRYHRGIKGGADLDPALHGWKGPIARVTVRRIK
jgi:hypothetical protein